MKKILFFDRLDYLTLIFAIFFRPFFKKIVFRNANYFFKNLKIHKYLNFIGIDWISFYNLDYKIYSHSHKLRAELENNYMRNQVLKNPLIQDFIKEYKLKDKQIEKLYLCFTQNLYLRADENSEASTVILINKFFPEKYFKVYFVPYNALCYLLLKELNQRNVTIIGIHALVNSVLDLSKNIFRLFLILIKRSLSYKKSNKKNENSIEKKISYCSIAFFPHKSLKYGDFFKKTYLYESNKESPFFKEKILTLFWEESDEISKRYFKRYNIPNANFFELINKRLLFFKASDFVMDLMSFKNFYILRSLQEFFFFFLFLKFKFRFIIYLNVLNQLNFLKVIYVHYDVLFPQSFNLACNTKGITTISSQERPMLHIFSGPLCYNKYLIVGQGFNNILRQKGYICDYFIDAGLPRSNYINNVKNLAVKRVNKYTKIKKTKKIIACFGLMHVNEFDVGLTGESGVSSRSNINFAKTILNLSKNFEKLHFVLRFKDTKTINIIPNKISLEIKENNNFEIHKDLKSINSYDLLKVADVVIGKPSTILEEAMAAGKEVIIYDDDNYLSSINYIYDELGVIEKDYKGLEKRVKDIIEGKYDPSKKIKNFVKKYYCSNTNNNGFDFIKKQISSCLQG